MKQTIFGMFFVVVGCFLSLLVMTNKQVVLVHANQTFDVNGVCSLHMGRRPYIQCQPDIETLDCTRLIGQKCPEKKLQQLGRVRVQNAQIQSAKAIFGTPQTCLIVVGISTRGRFKIKQIQFGNDIFVND